MSSLNFVDINTHQNATYPGSRGVFHFEDKTCDTELRRLLLITKSSNLYSKKTIFSINETKKQQDEFYSG